MQVGCGCVNLGSASNTASTSEQIKLVRTAIDLGVTVFDTADAYGNGSSERLLGRALADRRQHVTISTKAGYVFRPRSSHEQRARRIAATVQRAVTAARARIASTDGDAPIGTSGPGGSYQHQDFSPAHITAAVEASVQRLGTDYVDVLQLHGPVVFVPGLLDELQGLRERGLVRRFGVGSESVESAREWVGAANLDVIQLPFGVLDPEASREVFESARIGDVQIWARGVLGGGVLAAAMNDIDSVSTHPKSTLIRAFADIATQAGMGIDELAVRWVRRHSHVSTMLVGMSSRDHLRRNVALSELPALPDDVAAAIDSARSTFEQSPGDVR